MEQNDAAYDALSKAIELSPESAAAWADFGRAAMAQDEPEAAADAFHMVILLAPESEYAETARAKLSRLTDANDDGVVQQAGYEIRRFDAEEQLDRIEDADPPERRWIADALDFRLETGLLYNTNVALAPVSRQLAPGRRESFQFFAAPDLQWAAVDQQTWRTGPTFRGRFTLNEEPFERFNLQSYRPGWFAERFVFGGQQIFVPRIAYDFTHDEFDGSTVGNRHGLLASVSTIWDDCHASFVYWSVDRTDFANDGLLPDVTSQDGWTNSIGLSHDVALPYQYCRLVRAGVDLSRADTDGSDYRYRGVNFFGEAVIPLVETVELTLIGGWGYRDYFDFEFEPSRNEFLWRGTVELRKYFNPNFSAAGVFDYNRFNSDNPFFTAERTVAGVIAEFEY